MVKGINKQIIVLKIDGHRLYESACFVLKKEASVTREKKSDMLAEANRILEEMELGGGRQKKKRHILRKLLGGVLLLLVGAAIGFCVSFWV